MEKIKKRALILVDLQNDFCQGGSLAVPGGDEVISLANQLQGYFDLVVATQDWHPSGHVSFVSSHPGYKAGEVVLIGQGRQELWPEHCVQNTTGAEFHPELDTKLVNKVVHKGTEKTIDSYSTFFDNQHQRSTGLAEYLAGHKIQDVYIMGLATDYCVKFSCKDAVALGFNVYMIADGCRGVDLRPGDVMRTLEELQLVGVSIINSQDLKRML